MKSCLLYLSVILRAPHFESVLQDVIVDADGGDVQLAEASLTAEEAAGWKGSKRKDL